MYERIEQCLMKLFSIFLFIKCFVTVKPISTSLVYKPKQLVTETQISLSCQVEGSVPDTDIKWTQNNRLFERGSVSTDRFFYNFKISSTKFETFNRNKNKCQLTQSFPFQEFTNEFFPFNIHRKI